MSDNITPAMQRRISSSHISRCSLAFEVTQNNTNPDTGEEYELEDIAKGYLYSHETISNDDYVLALEILGFDEVKKILEK